MRKNTEEKIRKGLAFRGFSALR